MEKIKQQATKEEIYWLETLGRNKVADFQDGDVYVDSNGDATKIDGEEVQIEDAVAMYNEKDFIGLYPVDSFKRFPMEDF